MIIGGLLALIFLMSVGCAAVAPTTPNFKGYIFDGWYSSPQGQGLKISSSMHVSEIVQGIYGRYNDIAGGINGDEVTLYANWIERSYTIQYRSIEGEEMSPDQTYKWTNSIALPEQPTKEGYTFDCWRTNTPNSKGTPRGTIVTDGMALSSFVANVSKSTITLYAYWTENS